MNNPTCPQCDCVAGCQANPVACPNVAQPEQTASMRQPLTEVQIDTICQRHWAAVKASPMEAHRAFANPIDAYRAFARAIEVAHGIAQPVQRVKPEAQAEPVATVIEELEHDGQGWCAKVRWIYNPVPLGETLSWEQAK